LLRERGEPDGVLGDFTVFCLLVGLLWLEGDFFIFCRLLDDIEGDLRKVFAIVCIDSHVNGLASNSYLCELAYFQTEPLPIN
jgi:hypothetical protein